WSTSAPIAQVPPGFRWPSPSAPAWRRSAANTYPGLTKSQGGTPGEPHSETAPLYVIREAGVIVDLACEPPHAMDPAKHALILLHALMRDDCAGEPATEKTLRKYYITICRAQGIKPFPWLSVVRSSTDCCGLSTAPLIERPTSASMRGAAFRSAASTGSPCSASSRGRWSRRRASLRLPDYQLTERAGLRKS